jgi:hypothetical protein
MQVDNMVCIGESLSSILHGFLESDFSYSQFEGLRVDSSEVIDEDNTQFAPTFSYSNTEEATSHSMNNISCEEPYNKNNNKSNGFFLSLGSCRRKGAPKRSPLS